MDALRINDSKPFTVNPISFDNDSQFFYLFSVPCFHDDNCNSSIFGSNPRHQNASNAAAGDQFNDFNSKTDRPTAELVVLGILAGSIILVTVAGNLVVLLSFLLESSIRQPTNYFLASLAVSDLLIGTASMPFYTIYLLAGTSWPLGEVLCDLWLSVDYTVCLTSIYTVLCITIDRFCSVKIPAKYRKWRTERKVSMIIAIIWTIPFLVFFPSIFGWQYFVGVRTVPEGKCYVQYMESAIFNVLLQLGYFWITMVVMCSLYSGIYKVALNLQRKSEAKWRQTASLVSVAGEAVTQLGIRVASQSTDQHPDTTESVGDDRSRSDECVTSINRLDRKSKNINTGFHDNDNKDQYSSEYSSDSDAREVKGQAIRVKVRLKNHFHQRRQVTEKRKPSWKQKNAEKKQLSRSHLPSVVLPIVCSPLLRSRSSFPPLPTELLSPPVSPTINGKVLNDPERFGMFSSLLRTFSLKCSGARIQNGLNADVGQRRASEYVPSMTAVLSSCLPRLSSVDPQSMLEYGVVGHQGNTTGSIDSLRVLDDVASDDFFRQATNRRDSTKTQRSTKYPRRSSSLQSIESSTEDVSSQRSSAIPDTPVWIRRSSFAPTPDAVSTSASLCTNKTCTRTPQESNHPDEAESGLRQANGVEASIEKEPDGKTSISCGTFLRRRRAMFRKTLSAKRSRRRPLSFRRNWSTSRLFCLRRRLVPAASDQQRTGGDGTPGPPSRAPSKRENRARKALRTITIILGAFVVCWTPWHILSLIIGFCPNCVDTHLYDVSYWLCYLNSPINPFCYAFANPQFKKTFLRIFMLDWRRS